MQTLFSCIACLLFSCSAFAQAELFGRVTTESGERLENVQILAVNEETVSFTNVQGEYQMSIPSNKEVIIRVNYTGYQSQIYFIEIATGKKQKLNIELSFDDTLIEDVVIEDEQIRRRASGFEVNEEQLDQLPAVSGGVETLIKSLPGVAANNELSSQYSVRGGSYDENSLVINSIPVIRPQLIRSGQQEGLSVLNPDLVSDIYFSSGGFEPQFGDKLSSVLAVDYNRSTKQRGKAYLSFLGAGASMQNTSSDKQFYYTAGARYLSRKYLLNSLEEEGEYNPESYDVQALLGYQLSEKSSLEVFGLSNQTQYDFTPNLINANFGTFDNILTFNADIDGEEQDEFGSDLVSLQYKTNLNERTNLNFSAAWQQNNEEESIDFLSDYLLGQEDLNTGEIDTLAEGFQRDFVMNELLTTSLQFNHNGVYESKNRNHYIAWGAGIQQLTFEDAVNELDELITMSENNVEEVVFQQEVNSANDLENTVYSAYVQDTWVPGNGDFTLTGGMRASYADFTKESLISPRLQLSYRPDWQRDIIWKAAAGLYQQHPLYREFRNIDGELNENVEAQKSFHAILGADYNFNMNDLPFNFTAEAFYKNYWDVVPYEYDVIRIRYLGENVATAYAAGLDLRLYGEFVEDAPSWLSLSLLKTEEEIEGQGTVRRPTDQRVNFSAYWQDYLPGNKNFKVNLIAEYGGRLPVGVADGNRLNDDFELPSYKRVDVGFSANLKGKKAARLPYSPFEKLNSIWFSAEVFNLFNIDNTSSYQWVFTPQGATYAVPNRLTSRRLNAKLTVEF